MNLIHPVDPDGIPNLDAMNDDELRAFATRHSGGNHATELFDSDGKQAKEAAKDLAHYAWNALTARSCRVAGGIDTALNYERIAQSIYNELPEWARW